MKRFITLVFCLLPILISAITRHVALDGSQPYISIQLALNESSSGDIVLVYPGRYLENLNLSNMNGITLASLEYTTNDTSYVSATIIDGSNHNTSTILCYQNTVNCTIRGLSITGGSGYDIYIGDVPTQVEGGGIFIYLNCNLTLLNLNIYNNKAAWGGGITIIASSTVYMSHVNIYNNIAKYRGGGLAFGSNLDYNPNIIFSQSDRCSIYNNFAQYGMDIDWYFINGGTLAVYLKKFTVPQWEKYYADYYDSEYPPSPYTVFDIQESYLQPVDADLYVSPTGNDSNSGLTPAMALKTPSIAMQKIASNPDNPKTVHLLAGEHHNTINGEYLPIAIKDYTTLQGLSQAATRIYAENLVEGTGAITMGIERYGMQLKDLSITTQSASAMFSWGVYDCAFENVTIENSTVDRWLFMLGAMTSTYTLRNITMRNNIALDSDFGLQLNGSVITMDNIVMQDNRTQSLPASEFWQGCGGFDIYVIDSLIVKNSKFVNNTHYSVDGFANFRVITWSSTPHSVVTFDNCLFASNNAYSGSRDIDLFSLHEVNLVNCTFANNTNEYTDYQLITADTTRIVNCLFSHNTSTYEIRTKNSTYIENCLFSRSHNLWRTINGEPLNWGNSNLIGTDPLFSGDDTTLPSFYYLFADEEHGFSPAIDAGTSDPNILPVGYQIPDYDVFGNNRIHGNGIDIGCFESPGYTSNEDDVPQPIKSLSLSNYPNPFNPNTTISYSVPKDGEVKLNIFNIKGQHVKTLVSESKKSGVYSIIWNGDDQAGSRVSSGLYFTRMETNGKTLTNKMIMLK